MEDQFIHLASVISALCSVLYVFFSPQIYKRLCNADSIHALYVDTSQLLITVCVHCTADLHLASSLQNSIKGKSHKELKARKWHLLTAACNKSSSNAVQPLQSVSSLNRVPFLLS